MLQAASTVSIEGWIHSTDTTSGQKTDVPLTAWLSHCESSGVMFLIPLLLLLLLLPPPPSFSFHNSVSQWGTAPPKITAPFLWASSIEENAQHLARPDLTPTCITHWLQSFTRLCECVCPQSVWVTLRMNRFSVASSSLCIQHKHTLCMNAVFCLAQWCLNFSGCCGWREHFWVNSGGRSGLYWVWHVVQDMKELYMWAIFRLWGKSVVLSKNTHDSLSSSLFWSIRVP